mmetsp:Transcript_317/g.682  ORF Transcript_317/g.682 Transcript_317/m.682 type:complete len:175 (-) Transcript_317:29-553(-)
MADSDFIAMTQDGALCNKKGLLDWLQFEKLMQDHIRLHIQTQLAGPAAQTLLPEEQAPLFIGALKMLMMEQQELLDAVRRTTTLAVPSKLAGAPSKLIIAHHEPNQVKQNLMFSPGIQSTAISHDCVEALQQRPCAKSAAGTILPGSQASDEKWFSPESKTPAAAKLNDQLKLD